MEAKENFNVFVAIVQKWNSKQDRETVSFGQNKRVYSHEVPDALEGILPILSI